MVCAAYSRVYDMFEKLLYGIYITLFLLCLLIIVPVVVVYFVSLLTLNIILSPLLNRLD